MPRHAEVRQIATKQTKQKGVASNSVKRRTWDNASAQCRGRNRNYGPSPCYFTGPVDALAPADSRSAEDSVTSSNTTTSRATFVPFKNKAQLPKPQKDELAQRLDEWRTKRQAAHSNGRSLCPNHGGDFLRASRVIPDLICKLVPLDLASTEELEGIADVIDDV
ncbi:hypothetical protein B0H10DRAFT_1950979 [Mycena sp. CBHHK59/15]|nr:hypothetical protein B0H10DRAFT_1950979 [Mycena sp. CBHHK59/15]